MTWIDRVRRQATELQGNLDTLRVTIKILLHDLESTRREREAWKLRAEWLEEMYAPSPYDEDTEP